jgi:hypothetical protein
MPSRAFVSVSVFSASGQRPVSGVRCPVSGVRCPVRASSITRACPRGRCPVSSVGVRCPWVPASSVRPAGCGGWRWGTQPPHGRVGVVACGVHGQFVGCPGRDLAVEAGAGRAGPAEGSAWTWPSFVGGGWAVARSTAWATRIGWMGAGIARWWRAGVRSEVATTLRGHRARPRAGSPGRCKPPGLDCDLRARPWCGRSMRRAPPARRWRRSDLQCWGWR